VASIPIGGDMDAALRKLKATFEQDTADFNARVEALLKPSPQTPKTPPAPASAGPQASNEWGSSTQRPAENKDRLFSARLPTSR
jgi:hypothetical protein